MALVGKIAAVVMIAFLAGCSLFFPTQVSFQNNTSTYTFLAIKLGPLDYETTLSPGQQTAFFTINPGLYSLLTKGIEGVFYQWPAQQEVTGGYSYTIIFSVNSATNSLVYSTYVALQR